MPEALVATRDCTTGAPPRRRMRFELTRDGASSIGGLDRGRKASLVLMCMEFVGMERLLCEHSLVDHASIYVGITTSGLVTNPSTSHLPWRLCYLPT